MILVLNCGSQSIKWKVFNDKLRPVKEGGAVVLSQNLFQQTLQKELKKIARLQIEAVGHRIVYGGEKYSKPIKITDKNLQDLEKLNHLAPLHNPFNILGIKTSRSVFKNAQHFAVFDTEFFSNLPKTASKYALPEKIENEFGFKRMGFHGISHEYAAMKAGASNGGKIITCHLGGGSSIAAIKDGKAIDTSMGFTPLEGLVMMTRSGNIDAGIVLEIAEKYGIENTREILNKESGIKGICGQSEMLKVLERIKQGDSKAKLALDIFVYSIKKYIGAYFAILGGCDVLVFTGAIGAGNAEIRNMICKDLGILNKTKILAIETDEELAIAEKIVCMN